MNERDPRHATPPATGGDGVRVVQTERRGVRVVLPWLVLGVVALGVGGAWWLGRMTPAATPDVAMVETGTPARPPSTLPRAERRAPVAMPTPSAHEDPPELRSLDRDDIAAWVRPGDPEPSMAEVIEALRHAGIHDGIAAFNPPGTRPSLEGLAVPEDFELPEGYMRHHQSTDGGEAIEPILMFSPDFAFFDEAGEPVTLPEDLVVPPELAPPGMPLRRVRIPSD